MYGVGARGQARNAIRFGFAAEEIDEVKTGVAAGRGIGDQLWRRPERLVLLRRGDGAVLLHAVEHVSEPVLGAIRMPIGIVVVWSLQQSRQHRRLRQSEILGGFAEIAARGHLDAPRTAAE